MALKMLSAKRNATREGNQSTVYRDQMEKEAAAHSSDHLSDISIASRNSAKLEYFGSQPISARVLELFNLLPSASLVPAPMIFQILVKSSFFLVNRWLKIPKNWAPN